MRTFLSGFKEMMEKLRKIKGPKKPEEIFAELGYLSAEDRDFRYGQVFRLTTNFDKMDSEDLKKYWMVSYYYYYLFLESGFQSISQKKVSVHDIFSKNFE